MRATIRIPSAGAPAAVPCGGSSAGPGAGPTYIWPRGEPRGEPGSVPAAPRRRPIWTYDCSDEARKLSPFLSNSRPHENSASSSTFSALQMGWGNEGGEGR